LTRGIPPGKKKSWFMNSNSKLAVAGSGNGKPGIRNMSFPSLYNVLWGKHNPLDILLQGFWRICFFGPAALVERN
jgi:hypothetical protein